MPYEAKCTTPSTPLRDQARRFRQRYEACQIVLARGDSSQRRLPAVAGGDLRNTTSPHVQALSDVTRRTLPTSAAERAASLFAHVSATARQLPTRALLSRQALGNPL
ncbi:MAG: hypothetical protein OQK79_02040 [Rhodanobacter sp.]|jgi:hypothetical protein|nr:hypothetical protein [Rhodanobacter sp.]